jgi:hypothetical protein
MRPLTKYALFVVAEKLDDKGMRRLTHKKEILEFTFKTKSCTPLLSYNNNLITIYNI